MFEQLLGMSAYEFAGLHLDERRRMYAALTKEHQDAVFDEYMNAKTDMTAPVGSLVKNKHEGGICLYDAGGKRYKGLAIVIGQRRADNHRRLYLLGKLHDRDGNAIVTGETDTESLEVVENVW